MSVQYYAGFIVIGAIASLVLIGVLFRGNVMF